MTGEGQRYRKRSVEVEAVQWTGANDEEIRAFMDWVRDDAAPEVAAEYHVQSEDGNNLTISTSKGHLRASTGDWVIRGVKGEYYLRRPDIFAASYDAIEDAPR